MAEQTKTSYIGLARRYRPQTFSDLVGQDQVARALEQQVLQEKVSQAFIFSGPRGIGKTSAARILAKCLNCLKSTKPVPHPCGECEQCRSITSGNSMDVIEIDGASNNSVDDIRNLQETINHHPFAARKKVYIIDEVHMLSKGAFNALLKTLEEPPPFVVFIFATTELEKIPETIKSRCQLFQFRRIPIEDIIRRLDYVVEREKIEMDPGERRAILETIAFAVDGGLRDALMALDQIAALSDGGVRLDETVRFLGVVEHELLIQSVEWLHQRNTRALLEMVNSLVERGRDLERFVKNLLGFLRDLMILKSGGGEELVNLSGDKLARTKALLWKTEENGKLTEVLTYPALLNFIQMFMALEAGMREAVQVRIHLEFAFVKLAAIEPMVDIANLIENFDKWVGGSPAGAPVQVPAPSPQTSLPSFGPPAAPAARPISPPPRPATPDLFGDRKTAANPVRDLPGQTAEAPQSALDGDDVSVLWPALLERRKQLGMTLTIALKDCQCLGGAGNVLRLGVPKKSLSLGTLQAAEYQSRVHALLSRLAGRPVGLQIVPVEVARAAETAASSSAAPTPPSGYGSASMPAATASSPSAVAPVSRVKEPAPPAFATPRNLQSAIPNPQFFASPPEEGIHPASNLSTYELYLAQNPAGRIRNALKNNETLREKAEMVRRFFDGQLLDASGQEIVL
jgi:DNA polymerase-3 subunit gamma/tau